MKFINLNIKTTLFVLLAGMLTFFACKEDEQIFPETRLFRPVLNEDLSAIGNSIIIDLGNMKKAVSYTIDISRDTFKTIDYTLETDTSYVVVDDELLGGDPLFWNTLYQVRAIAHAADPQFDSKLSDLGNVRTERFPTILNIPAVYDVTDVAARVSWSVAGAPVTGVKVFAPDDLKLTTPLFDEHAVSAAEQESGETIITGLDPSSEYQVAIYSGDNLRGWVNYTTKVPDIDPNGPNVIDIRDNESPSAVHDAAAAAPDGAIILVKRGVIYDFPDENLDKSITIRAAYGFGEQKAMLYTTGNWDIADNSTIDHIRFIDLELRGENYGGDYIFNPSRDNVFVGEVLFENCEIGTFRGIMRIRKTVIIDNFKIINSVVDSIGGYGILTADTDPGDPQTATFNNIVLKGSTFNKVYAGITSRNNSQSILIEDCTFHNFILGGSGNYIFRYRGSDGNNNVLNGITIRNSLFGPGWDEGGTESYTFKGMQGLESTPFDIVNTYSTANFEFSGNVIPGFPIGNYSGTADQLWVEPDMNNFNFQDQGFSGRFDTGDPRWRVKL